MKTAPVRGTNRRTLALTLRSAGVATVIQYASYLLVAPVVFRDRGIGHLRRLGDRVVDPRGRRVLADAGLRLELSRRVADAAGADDPERLRRTVHEGTSLLAWVALGVLVVGCVAAPLIRMFVFPTGCWTSTRRKPTSCCAATFVAPRGVAARRRLLRGAPRCATRRCGDQLAQLRSRRRSRRLDRRSGAGLGDLGVARRRGGDGRGRDPRPGARCPPCDPRRPVPAGVTPGYRVAQSPRLLEPGPPVAAERRGGLAMGQDRVVPIRRLERGGRLPDRDDARAPGEGTGAPPGCAAARRDRRAQIPRSRAVWRRSCASSRRQRSRWRP